MISASESQVDSENFVVRSGHSSAGHQQQGRRRGGGNWGILPWAPPYRGPRQVPLLPLSYTCTKDRNTLIEQSP